VPSAPAAGGEPKLVAKSPNWASGAAPWSPDGRFVLVCRLAGSSVTPLTRIEVQSLTSKVVGKGECNDPAWSPDGSTTAAADDSRESGVKHLVIRTADGSFLADLGKAARWGGVVWTRP